MYDFACLLSLTPLMLFFASGYDDNGLLTYLDETAGTCLNAVACQAKGPFVDVEDGRTSDLPLDVFSAACSTHRDHSSPPQKAAGVYLVPMWELLAAAQILLDRQMPGAC